MSTANSAVSRALPALTTRSREHVTEDELATVLEQASMVLGTGVAPQLAWSSVAQAHAETPSGDLAERLAQTPPALLSHDQHSPLTLVPQGPALLLCLAVCDKTGAPLEGLLGSLATTLRALTDAQRARASAFAGARTTAHILMALPALAIALGYAIGANPLRFLFGSALGFLMLGIGVALTAAGWVWMMGLLRAAEPDTFEIDPVIVIEVLAHTVSSGLPLPTALTRIGEALGTTAPGPELEAAGRSLALGADPAHALAMLEGDLAMIRTSVLLSHTTGARLAPLLKAASTDIRRSRLRDVERSAATLNVRLVLPTGLTILPAFVVLGIIPIVTDLLSTYFGWF